MRVLDRAQSGDFMSLSFSVSFMFSRVVDRAVDDRRPCRRRTPASSVGSRSSVALDAVALGAEALGVLHEVRILEVDVAGPAEVAQLVPGDQPVLGVVPDQDHERRLHAQRRLDLLRVHQEAGVARHRDHLALRVGQLGGDRARHRDAHRREAVGDDAGVGPLGLVHARTSTSCARRRRRSRCRPGPALRAGPTRSSAA